MVDVFSEVDEQLRAERLHSFMRMRFPAITTAVLCVLAVVVVWGVQAWQTNESSKASQAYQDALDTAGQGRRRQGLPEFDALAKHAGPYQGPGADAGSRRARGPEQGRRSRGPVRQGRRRQQEPADLRHRHPQVGLCPDGHRAARRRWKPSSRRSPPPAGPSASRPARPWPWPAWARGKTAAAKADLVAISLQQDTPDSARQRAQAIIALIDSGTAPGSRSWKRRPAPPRPSRRRSRPARVRRDLKARPSKFNRKPLNDLV